MDLRRKLDPSRREFPIRTVLPSMTNRGSGCILAISSAPCRAPMPGFSLLSTSKAALEALIRALAVEFGPLGIRINMIEASMIDGDNSSVVDAAQREHVLRAIPLRRIARPADVAGVIPLIASRAARFINGATT
jgi:NAD(P)-dependent dehydrogenase (short-subunit alcohol dehydrogenase family)